MGRLTMVVAGDMSEFTVAYVEAMRLLEHGCEWWLGGKK
jgi:hypothetical protein